MSIHLDNSTAAAAAAVAGLGVLRVDSFTTPQARTAAIQLALDTGGKVLLSGPAGKYPISSMLLIGDNTTLELAPGIQITTSVDMHHMLASRSTVPVRSVSDAAITAASKTLTSATAAFTSADIGRMVRVVGVAYNTTDGGPLTAQIVSVESGTSCTLSIAAGKTASGAALSIHQRSKNITVKGGWWDKGNFTVLDLLSHILCFQHVDGLVVRDLTVGALASRYALATSDCPNFVIENIAGWADGYQRHNCSIVQCNGPQVGGWIRGITGWANDDAVALTARDYAGQEDTCGDMTDITIDGVNCRSETNTTKALAGNGPLMARITIKNVRGFGFTSMVVVGNDNVSDNTDNSTVSDIVIEDIAGSIDPVGGLAVVAINPYSFNRISVKNIAFTESVAVAAGVRAGGTGTGLIISGVMGETDGGSAVILFGDYGGTMGTVSVDNCHSVLKADRSQGTFINITTAIEVLARGCTVVGGSQGIYLSGSSACKVSLSDYRDTSNYGIMQASSALCTVHTANYVFSGGNSAFTMFSGGSSFVISGDARYTAGSTLYRTGSQSIRFNGDFAIAASLAGMAPVRGDRILNSDASNDPYRYNGSAWVAL